MVGTRNQQKRKIWKTALFFSPSILLLGVFFIGPMIMTVFFSFTDISLTGSSAQAMKFVGFRNFIEIFKDPKLLTVLKNTMVFLVFSGIIGQQCLGFLLASLMRGKNRLVRKFVGFTVVAGWITPEVIAAFMFSSFFADAGTLNKIIGIFGASPVSWLFTFPMACVVIANIWKGSAYSMMMFQASLDNISDDIVEAARIDGAGGLQILLRITLPMINHGNYVCDRYTVHLGRFRPCVRHDRRRAGYYDYNTFYFHVSEGLHCISDRIRNGNCPLYSGNRYSAEPCIYQADTCK